MTERLRALWTLLGLLALALLVCLAGRAQAQSTQCVANVSAQGTVNAITSATLPCGTTTNLVLLTALGANTSTTVTYQPVGSPALPITRPLGVALSAGDISGAGFIALLTPTGSSWVLLNPASVPGGLSIGATAIAGGTSGQYLYNNAGVLGNAALSIAVGAITGLGTGVGGALAAPLNNAGGLPGINGTLTSGDCLKWSASGIQDQGASCGSASGITVGSTSIGGGVPGDVEFDNAGTLGELPTTGSGSVVLSTSPVLVTPNLGVPSFVTLTNATGLPVLTGISGLGLGVGTALTVAPGASGAMFLQSGTVASGDCVYATGSGLADRGLGCRPVIDVTRAPYSADNTGTIDATTAINTAFTASGTLNACVYFPGGTYKVTNALTTPTTNYCAFGDGETKSVLSTASASFNLSALGVLVIPNNSGGNGGILHDFGISFSQPDTASRGSLVAFPPGIYSQGAARQNLYNIQISQAITCIDARGNAGGVFFTNINCGALSYGLRMDGSLDGDHVTNWHEWDFGISTFTGLSSIYFDGTNVCMELGRVDWISIAGAQCFSANMHWTSNASNSVDSNMVSNLSLDSSVIIVDGAPPTGIWMTNVQNSNAPTLPASLNGITVNSGNVNITNCRFGISSNATVPTVVVTAGNLQLVSCNITSGATGEQAAKVTGGSLEINSSVLSAVNGITAPVVEQVGGNLRMKGDRFSAAPVGGAGIGVKYDLDTNATNTNSNYFGADNVMVGWTLNLPATVANGVFSGFLFSAAGTPLPTCNSGLRGRQYQVSDATAPTYAGTYASGGTVTAQVTCADGNTWKTE